MGRDEQFEIQYLISLIIAVMGAISVNGIRYSIDIPVAHLFLVVAFLHLIMFNISYTIEKATEFETRAADSFRDLQDLTLIVVTAGFLFLVVHMIGMVAISTFTECSATGNIFLITTDNIYGCLGTKIVIAYAFPILLIGMIGWGAAPSILTTISLFNNIEFSVAPHNLRIYYQYDETEPVLIKVENHTGKEQEFNLSVDLPDGVIAKEGNQEAKEIFSKTLVIPPDRQKLTNLHMRYVKGERRRAEIDVSISHERGEKQESIDALLIS